MPPELYAFCKWCGIASNWTLHWFYFKRFIVTYHDLHYRHFSPEPIGLTRIWWGGRNRQGKYWRGSLTLLPPSLSATEICLRHDCTDVKHGLCPEVLKSTLKMSKNAPLPKSTLPPHYPKHQEICYFSKNSTVCVMEGTSMIAIVYAYKANSTPYIYFTYGLYMVIHPPPSVFIQGISQNSIVICAFCQHFPKVYCSFISLS